jgi:hypothetical protein
MIETLPFLFLTEEGPKVAGSNRGQGALPGIQLAQEGFQPSPRPSCRGPLLAMSPAVTWRSNPASPTTAEQDGTSPVKDVSGHRIPVTNSFELMMVISSLLHWSSQTFEDRVGSNMNFHSYLVALPLRVLLAMECTRVPGFTRAETEGPSPSRNELS